MFKQPLWLITVGHYIGILGICLGIYFLYNNIVSYYWILCTIFFYILSSLMLSVGLHRYFSHASFSTGTFWHIFMSMYSVLLVNGSAQGWAAAHNTHHKYSDTDRDPHIANWTYIFYKRYKNVQMVLYRVKQLCKDNIVNFTHRYGLLLWILFCIITVFISWKFFIYGYLMPLGLVHVVGALHQIFSHKNDRPRNLAILEFILPACGEWMHKTHHDYPGRYDYRTKWWHLDIGALFIKLIKN